MVTRIATIFFFLFFAASTLLGLSMVYAGVAALVAGIALIANV